MKCRSYRWYAVIFFMSILVGAAALAENGLRKTTSSAIYHGLEAITRLQNEARRSVNPLYSRLEFHHFMTEVVRRKLANSPDREFLAKVLLRDLRREHKAVLEEVDGAYYKARSEFEANAAAATLAELDKRIKGGNQAVESMSKFVNSESDHSDANADKIDNCRKLLPEKIRMLQEDNQAREELRRNTESYLRFELVKKERMDIYTELGLHKHNELVKKESKGSGTGRNLRGKNFESEAFRSLEEIIVPKVSQYYGTPPEELICVRNIKFGMASTKGSTAEIDALICRRRGDAKVGGKGTPVEVLAVCEVKRNADDCGDAFAGYQPSLRWLCGLREEYDPSVYVTKSFPSGHFDRAYHHPYHAGTDTGTDTGTGTDTRSRKGAKPEVLVFTVESFHRMRDARTRLSLTVREAGLMGVLPRLGAAEGDETAEDTDTTEVSLFLSSLFFICRAGKLDCITSKAMAWALDRCASDVRLGPGAALLSNNEGEDEGEGEGEGESERALRIAALDEIQEATRARYPPRMSTMDLLLLLNREALSDQVVVIS